MFSFEKWINKNSTRASLQHCLSINHTDGCKALIVLSLLGRELHWAGPGRPRGASEGLVPAAADQRQAEQQQQAGGQRDGGHRHHLRSVDVFSQRRWNVQMVKQPKGVKSSNLGSCCAFPAILSASSWMDFITDCWILNAAAVGQLVIANKWQIGAKKLKESENPVEFLAFWRFFTRNHQVN